jgi:hypothetical protein
VESELEPNGVRGDDDDGGGGDDGLPKPAPEASAGLPRRWTMV